MGREAASEVCTKMRNILSSRSFTDAIVRCGDQHFEVHRAILAASSPVFDAMFKTEGMKEGSERTVVIENSSPAAVGAMIEYMYVSEVPDDADVACLLQLADQYQLEGLLDLCGTLLINNVTEQNVVA